MPAGSTVTLCRGNVSHVTAVEVAVEVAVEHSVRCESKSWIRSPVCVGTGQICMCFMYIYACVSK